MIDKNTEEGLKYVSADIYHSVIKSQYAELSDRDWSYVCALLQLDPGKTIYCIETNLEGFILRTKRLSLFYQHRPSRYKSQVSVKKETYSVPVKLPFKLIEIRLHAVDGLGELTKTFVNVNEFADFLKDNPAYAQALGYVPKRNR